jgi:hypothetical protein
MDFIIGRVHLHKRTTRKKYTLLPQRRGAVHNTRTHTSTQKKARGYRSWKLRANAATLITIPTPSTYIQQTRRTRTSQKTRHCTLRGGREGGMRNHLRSFRKRTRGSGQSRPPPLSPPQKTTANKSYSLSLKSISNTGKKEAGVHLKGSQSNNHNHNIQ